MSSLSGARFERLRTTSSSFTRTVHKWLTRRGRRFGHLTACPERGGLALEALLLDTLQSSGVVVSAPLPDEVREYPSLTSVVPAAHWAERKLGDFFGIRPTGHPRWKTLILHNDAWPLEFLPFACGRCHAREPYSFLRVLGEGIHEIPVGPIHAGVIEPGHFRFSCIGEIVANLEIRLGYQHRGIEKRLAELPWPATRFLAESAASDTAVGNALAHAVAVEDLLGLGVPPRAQALRTIALELERIANHLGDIGALSGDIGYSAGSALFAPLRAATLALAQLLTGNRLQRWFVLPGGVARDLGDQSRLALEREMFALFARTRDLLPIVLENPAVIDRMEGTGRLAPSLAREFGLVGPAGRASGGTYDARAVFHHGIYPEGFSTPAIQQDGDVLARAQVRADEIESSFSTIAALIVNLPSGAIQSSVPSDLPPDSVGIGIVEAWRGELIHWITTDENGAISRYAIKDPSFNNWTGLAIAVRNNLVADFPLCNKSFNLSYSGNDL